MSSMSIHLDVLNAPDRESVHRILRDSSSTELRGAVEPLATEVLRLLRVDPRKAFEAAERAEILAERVQETEPKARVRWIKGHAHSAFSQLHEAASCYEEAAELYEELGRRAEVARIAIGQVNVLTYMGEYRKALAVGERARDVLSRTGQRPAAARMDLNLGNIYYRIEQPRRALSRYDRALRFARRSKDPGMTHMIQVNRGTVLSALGDLDRAEKLLRAAEDEARLAGERRIQAIARFNLGYIFFQRGEYGEAFDTLEAARAAFEDLGDEHYLTNTLIDLTELLIEVNDFRRAPRIASEARARAQKLGLPFETGRTALFQGVAALAGGAMKSAQSFLEEARETFREGGHFSSQALCEVYLARVAARQDEGSAASRMLRRAAAVFREEGMRLHEAAARLSQASVDLTRGRRKTARASLDSAARSLRGVPSPWLRARLAHLRGRLAEVEGRDGWAIRHYRRAVDTIESIRGRIGIDEFRVSFAEDKAPVYADLVHAILRRGGKDSVAEAFSAVERARSRALVDLLAGRLRPAARAADPETRRLIERMNKLRAEINRLSGFGPASPGKRTGFRRRGVDTSRLRDRESRMIDTIRRLERRDTRLGALAVGETITLAEAQDGLPSEATMVEYFLGTTTSCAFVIRRDEVRVVELPLTLREAERKVAHLRFQIEKRSYGEDYTRARSELLNRGVRRHLEYLSETVWEPLAIRDRRVVIVPHGALHAVPFAALPVATGGQVLDHHVVSYLPSASCRRYLPGLRAGDRSGSDGRNGTAAHGDPRLLAVEMDDEDIPEVRREVREVRRVFRRARVLTGDRATRDAFRKAARHADVIHVATHGLFRGDEPGFSSLRLADGWMSLYDVYGLTLDAPLVCLSACQTGRSLVGPGDELVGLSRGFLHAGASSLLVSLWPVHDRSTADLMIAFYRKLKARSPASECLRDAMREARGGVEHPYSWGAFILIGGPSV
jgi:CHAT domain-containing protein/tetratricopeptide (TPR) repeat protein